MRTGKVWSLAIAGVGLLLLIAAALTLPQEVCRTVTDGQGRTYQPPCERGLGAWSFILGGLGLLLVVSGIIAYALVATKRPPREGQGS